jgi:molybdate transport system regulatory protein
MLGGAHATMRVGNQTPGARLRVVLRPNVAIGPGKADLLQGIEETGSIAGAGRRMRMSYKRAWKLVESLNEDFGTPVVATTKGGAAFGGAELTSTGKRILTLYRSMERRAGASIEDDLKALHALINDISD